jgi:hypothetical protein
MFRHFASRGLDAAALAGSPWVPKKIPPSDEQENRQEPLLGRDMSPPAPADGDGFARRAGEIIARASASLYGSKNTRPNKRSRRSG